MTWQRWDKAGLCSASVWEYKIDSKCSRKSQQGCCQDSDLVCAAGWRMALLWAGVGGRETESQRCSVTAIHTTSKR